MSAHAAERVCVRALARASFHVFLYISCCVSGCSDSRNLAGASLSVPAAALQSRLEYNPPPQLFQLDLLHFTHRNDENGRIAPRFPGVLGLCDP